MTPHAAVFALIQVLWTFSVLEYGYSVGSLWGFKTPPNFLTIPDRIEMANIIGTFVLVSHFLNSALIQACSFLWIKRTKPRLHKTFSILAVGLTIATSVLMCIFLVMTADSSSALYKLACAFWIFAQVISSICYMMVYDFDRGYSINYYDPLIGNPLIGDSIDEPRDNRDPHMEQAIMNGCIVTPITYSILYSIVSLHHTLVPGDHTTLFCIAFIISVQLPLFYRIIITMRSYLQPAQKRTSMRCIFAILLIISHVVWIVSIVQTSQTTKTSQTTNTSQKN